MSAPPRRRNICGLTDTPPNSATSLGGAARKRASVRTVSATPGRLLDLVDKNAVSLTALQWLVLDEADRMLDAGFADELARADFLALQSFDRMHVTVLLQDRDGHWRRGAVEGDQLAYPASSVKLGFLVGAVHWCHEQDRAPDCLDEFVRPMIVDSDNVATGEVVDRISGVPNAPAAGHDAEAWIERRRYTERVLESAGLLG